MSSRKVNKMWNFFITQYKWNDGELSDNIRVLKEEAERLERENIKLINKNTKMQQKLYILRGIENQIKEYSPEDIHRNFINISEIKEMIEDMSRENELTKKRCRSQSKEWFCDGFYEALTYFDNLIAMKEEENEEEDEENESA